MPLYKVTSTGMPIEATSAFMADNFPGDYAEFPVVDPCQWLIDIGPFYDRFGSTKVAVLTSPDVAIKAIIQDLNIRKWVDLRRTDVAQAIGYIGTVVPSVTPDMKSSILTTPVTPDENLALRKLYFS